MNTWGNTRRKGKQREWPFEVSRTEVQAWIKERNQRPDSVLLASNPTRRRTDR